MKKIIAIVAGITLASVMAEATDCTATGEQTQLRKKNCGAQECAQDGSGKGKREGERKLDGSGSGKGECQGERKLDGSGSGTGDGPCQK